MFISTAADIKRHIKYPLLNFTAKRDDDVLLYHEVTQAWCQDILSRLQSNDMLSPPLPDLNQYIFRHN